MWVKAMANFKYYLFLKVKNLPVSYHTLDIPHYLMPTKGSYYYYLDNFHYTLHIYIQLFFDLVAFSVVVVVVVMVLAEEE